jgi:CRP-like cAMP-binding protein
MLTTIEKVRHLQGVDIFKYTTTEDLAYIAAITEEIELKPNYIVFKENEMSDAMYMVIEGKIRLDREGQIVMTARPKDVFGIWALFDDEPRALTATTLENSRLLRIDKEDFIDLLADHVRITQGILKTMVKRLRSLMSRVGI